MSKRLVLLALCSGWLISGFQPARAQDPASSIEQTGPSLPPISLDRLSYLELDELHRSIQRQLDALTQEGASDSDWVEYQTALQDLSQSQSERARMAREALERFRTRPNVKRRQQAIERWQEELSRVRGVLYPDFRRLGDSEIAARHQRWLLQPAPAVPQLLAMNLDVMQFPKIDGSTSTQPLAMLIGCRNFQLEAQWIAKDQKLKTEADADNAWRHFFRMREPELILAEYWLRAKAPEGVADDRLAQMVNTILVQNASTHQAYRNIISGASQIAMIARGPSEQELQLAAQSGVELDVSPCALDAFVVIVHRKNDVPGLTTSQLRSIYGGQRFRWDELGGTWKETVRPYRRPPDSGSEELMLSLVMKDTPMTDAVDRSLVGSLMSSVFIALVEDRPGIAYSVGYYENYMIGTTSTRTLPIDGVLATYETIQNRTYPHVAPVVVVTRRDLPADAPARKLRDWLLSDEGQQVVRQSGYVPIGSAP